MSSKKQRKKEEQVAAEQFLALLRQVCAAERRISSWSPMTIGELSLVGRTLDRLLSMVGAPWKVRYEVLKTALIGDMAAPTDWGEGTQQRKGVGP